MIEFADSIEIAQAPSEVFAFLADLENLPKIQSDVVKSTVLDSGPVRIGTRFDEVVKIGPRHVTARCVITEFEPGRLMAFTAKSKAVDYHGRFLVEPAGEGSRLSVEGRARLRRLWRVFEPLLAGDIRKGVRDELEAVKRHTEAFGTALA